MVASSPGSLGGGDDASVHVADGTKYLIYKIFPYNRIQEQQQGGFTCELQSHIKSPQVNHTLYFTWADIIVHKHLAIFDQNFRGSQFS